jgi:diguanylate cyclase (GGDEF)-like protein
MSAPHRPEQAPKNHFDVINLLMDGLVRALELGVEQEHRATHDSLTGLPNRAGLEQLLNANQSPQALLYIDSTNQKAVNDKLGHDRGDEVIIETARAIQASLRPDDIAARIGGDEFLVLLNPQRREANDHNQPAPPEEILKAVTGRMGQKFQDFLIENPDLTSEGVGLDLAIGEAIWQEGMSIDDLRLSAEGAMYKVKEGQHAASGSYR